MLGVWLLFNALCSSCGAEQYSRVWAMGLVTSPQSDPCMNWTWARFAVLKIIKNAFECVEVEPFVLNHRDEMGVYLRTQRGLAIFGRLLTRHRRSGKCTSSDVSRKDSDTGHAT